METNTWFEIAKGFYPTEEVFSGWAEKPEDSVKYTEFYFGGNQRAYGVTHWMHLPDPPTE